MIEIISIHIPKSGGTSFYKALQLVYRDQVSMPFKRRDVPNLNTCLEQKLKKGHSLRVLHGHFTYLEIEKLHQEYHSKIICWLRQPVERVISNFYFFKQTFENPKLNPEIYELNKHRINETLMEYAEQESNQNRMTKILTGIKLEDLFFIGLVEQYEKDLLDLQCELHWPDAPLFYENKRKLPYPTLSKDDFAQLTYWNELDVKLYEHAKRIKKNATTNP